MHNTPIEIVIGLYDQYTQTAKEIRQQELDTARIRMYRRNKR